MTWVLVFIVGVVVIAALAYGLRELKHVDEWEDAALRVDRQIEELDRKAAREQRRRKNDEVES